MCLQILISKTKFITYKCTYLGFIPTQAYHWTKGLFTCGELLLELQIKFHIVFQANFSAPCCLEESKHFSREHKNSSKSITIWIVEYQKLIIIYSNMGKYPLDFGKCQKINLSSLHSRTVVYWVCANCPSKNLGMITQYTVINRAWYILHTHCKNTYSYGILTYVYI